MRNGCTREWFVLVLAFLMLLAKSAVHSQNANEMTCSLLNNASLCGGAPTDKLGSHMRSAKLTCSGITLPGVVFGWYFGPLFGPERPIMNDSKYTITGDLNECLDVKNLIVNDTGAYFCRKMLNGDVQDTMPVQGGCINVESPALFSDCSGGESVVRVGCDADIMIRKEEKESVEFNAFFVHQDESLSCDSQEVDDVSLFINDTDPNNKLCGCSGTSNDFSCTSNTNDKRLDCSVHSGSNVTFTINNLTVSNASRYVVRATLRTPSNAQECIFKTYSLEVTASPTTTTPTEPTSSMNTDSTRLSSEVLAAIITVILVLLGLLAVLGFAVVYLILWTYYWKKKTKDGERIYDSPMVVFRRSKKKKKQKGPYTNRQSTHSINEEDKVVLHPDVNLSSPPEKV